MSEAVKLTITPKGVLGFMAKGLKGTKTIPFASITAIQHKRAGFTNGYLQFTLPGGNESRGGVFSAAGDEDTFMYSKAIESRVDAAKAFIEERMNALKKLSPSQPSTGRGLVDELARLGELRQQGLLSDEESTAAKRRLLQLADERR